MDNRSLEQDISMGEAAPVGYTPAEQNKPETGDTKGRMESVTDGAAYTKEFEAEQPYHEDPWDEESVPLSGEIYSYDTYFNKEDELVFGAYGTGDSRQETTGLSASQDDPFDPYKADEFTGSTSTLNSALQDSRTEFAGELSPAAGTLTSLAKPRERDWKRERARAEPIQRTQQHRSGIATPDDGQEAEAADRGKTWGWIAIILAVASLFYLPIVLGPAAVLIGAVAYFRGNKSLGIWSVVLGLLSFLAFTYLIPYYS